MGHLYHGYVSHNQRVFLYQFFLVFLSQVSKPGSLPSTFTILSLENLLHITTEFHRSFPTCSNTRRLDQMSGKMYQHVGMGQNPGN